MRDLSFGCSHSTASRHDHCHSSPGTILKTVQFCTGALISKVCDYDWMRTLTISRFFVAHVFLVPACIFALVASHIFLCRKAGPAGPVNEDPYHPKQKAEPFYPRQVLMDLSLTALLIIGLGLLCFFVPVQLGPPANPADAVRTAAGVVLPAHISVAEILAWVGRDHRRACNSNAPRPGHPCASFPGS